MNDKSFRKNAVKIIIFGLILVLMLWYLAQVFTFPKSRLDQSNNGDYSRERFNSFYAQQDNTIDCVFLGTSGMDRYWMPAFGWHDKGLATIELTTPSQQVMFAKYIMNEVSKTQDVKLFVIDLRMMIRDPSKTNNEIARRVTDNMKYSRNWLDTVINTRKLIKKNGGKPERLLTYLYTPIKYHARWAELKADDFTQLFPENEYMGYFGSDFIYDTHAQPSTVVTEDICDIPEGNLPIIKDFLEYCDSLDAEVIFVSTPMSCENEMMGKLNYSKKLVSDAGYKVYDFNTEEMYDAVGWDFDTDQYNVDHANFKGAVKFTRYLEDILVKEYGLEDHREDGDVSAYSDWEKGYQNTIEAANQYMPEFVKELTE